VGEGILPGQNLYPETGIPSWRPTDMKRFSLVKVTCESCGKEQAPRRWAGVCTSCEGASFVVEVERAASGWEAFDLEDFLPRPGPTALLDDGPSDLYWRTQSFLECRGVAGREVAAFTMATIEAGRKMYIEWKRRELEGAMSPNQRVCERCRVIFTSYRNKWNLAGFCSRSCAAAAIKSQRKAR
jgi:hypothetical protein